MESSERKLTEKLKANVAALQGKLEEEELAKNAMRRALKEQETELSNLRTENEFLTSQLVELSQEITSGRALLSQMSVMMQEKATQVCRFCQRSGTMPPRQ
eukprot:Trichotokara_eunicae@DN5891_c0_g1_i3.p3